MLRMTKLEHIQETIASLDQADLKTLSDWFSDYKFGLWDSQIEADANSGKLDKVIARVRENIKAGRTRPLA